MESKKIIKELLSVKKKFENKPVLTFETNIPMMIYDVVTELNRLNAELESNKDNIELGKAVRKAFERDAIIVYNAVYGNDGEILNYEYSETKEEFLEWAEGIE